MSKIISNTSPLIALSMIGKLHLLWDLFDAVYIPNGVFCEIINSENEVDYGKREVTSAVDEGKIKVYSVKDEILIRKMIGRMHKGELETIVGGSELNVDFVLIDEKTARNGAKSFLLTPIGTLGILRIAKQEEKIDKIKPFIDVLLEKGYRISQKLYEDILKKENEI
ncbi:UNVERIFIED_CONTAM: putative nucleic acid-binding protein [Acetivibrio alkalicellulosi]